MPIYEFRCLHCGHIFELLKLKQGSGKVKMKCPQCKSVEVERVLSRVSVVRSSGGKATRTDKKCGDGTCTTIDVPGPEK